MLNQTIIHPTSLRCCSRDKRVANASSHTHIFVSISSIFYSESWMCFYRQTFSLKISSTAACLNSTCETGRVAQLSPGSALTWPAVSPEAVDAPGLCWTGSYMIERECVLWGLGFELWNTLQVDPSKERADEPIFWTWGIFPRLDLLSLYWEIFIYRLESNR